MQPLEESTLRWTSNRCLLLPGSRHTRVKRAYPNHTLCRAANNILQLAANKAPTTKSSVAVTVSMAALVAGRSMPKHARMLCRV